MNTDRQWEDWGRRDPYFAVLSSAEYRRGGSKESFFATGEAHVSSMMRTISDRLVPGFQPSSALDFGCGVGRVTIALARRCHTTGVDVSPSMLEEAGRNAAAFNLAARFTDKADASYDLVHSLMVFQHIRPQRGLHIARDLLRRVNDGGVAVLHFTYGSIRHPAIKTVNWLRYRVPALHCVTNLLRGRPILDPPMQMNAYDLKELLPLFEGFRLHLQFTNHGGYLGCVFYAHRVSPAAT